MLSYIAILAVAALSGFVAYWFGRVRNGLALTAMALIWVGFTLMVFSGIEMAIDWGWYIGALIFVSAPVAVGAVLGAVIGWIKGGKDLYA